MTIHHHNQPIVSLGADNVKYQPEGRFVKNTKRKHWE
jgi:hypothetical protein